MVAYNTQMNAQKNLSKDKETKWFGNFFTKHIGGYRHLKNC